MADPYWFGDWVAHKLPKPDDDATKRTKRREYMRRWHAEHREERRRYMHQYYLKHKEKFCKPRKEHDYQACIVCGAPFYPVHFTDKYCCTRCRRSKKAAMLRKQMKDGEVVEDGD